MHLMTDRSPTLLFNFQTQNLALGGIGSPADGIAWKAIWGLCTGARLHQPQAQHVQSRKKRYDE